MKRIFFPIISSLLLVFLAGCNHEGKIKERPPGIVATGERAAIYQKIMAQFPEHQNVTTSQEALFAASASKQIVLTAESEVYATFISEGASYPNTFGWYSYTGSAPTQASDLKLNVLFPHVTDRVLRQGDRLRLGQGKFPAGTRIGFFLIINGWDYGTINYGRETFYTDATLNPDNQQQHVLFKQKDLGDIVLTFEDVLTSQESDKDFNDIIFTVTDNKDNQVVTRFDLTNVVQL